MNNELYLLVYERLISRRDVWAKQATKPDEKGKFQYFKQDSTITSELLKHSIESDTITIGAYCINNHANTVVNPQIDVDNHDGKIDVKQSVGLIYNYLVKIGTHPYIEASGGKIEDGAHIGLICQPTPAINAKEFLELVLKTLNLNYEVFPKQAEIEEEGFGSLVKLPFQFNNRTKARSELIDPDTMQPMLRERAVEYLLKLKDTDIPKLGLNESQRVELKKSSADIKKVPIIEYLNNEKIKPCINACYFDKWELHGHGSEGHDFRFAAVTELISWDVPDEIIHAYFAAQSDYSKIETARQIKQIRKKKYRPRDCNWIQKNCSTILKSFCDSCTYKKNNVVGEEDKQPSQPSSNNIELFDSIGQDFQGISIFNEPVTCYNKGIVYEHKILRRNKITGSQSYRTEYNIYSLNISKYIKNDANYPIALVTPAHVLRAYPKSVVNYCKKLQ